MALPSGLRRTGAEQIEDLFVFGKPPLLVLGEDALAVDHHVEHATIPFEQLRFDLELLGDPGRQTGGPR
jgi:hypothetical protein